MLQVNYLHKGRKVSKEQRNKYIKNPSLHLKEYGHQSNAMKLFFMVNVIHVMNMVRKLWNEDLMQREIMEYLITP